MLLFYGDKWYNIVVLYTIMIYNNLLQNFPQEILDEARSDLDFNLETIFKSSRVKQLSGSYDEMLATAKSDLFLNPEDTLPTKENFEGDKDTYNDYIAGIIERRREIVQHTLATYATKLAFRDMNELFNDNSEILQRFIVYIHTLSNIFNGNLDDEITAYFHNYSPFLVEPDFIITIRDYCNQKIIGPINAMRAMRNVEELNLFNISNNAPKD